VLLQRQPEDFRVLPVFLPEVLYPRRPELPLDLARAMIQLQD
jgi:hypothetical protein